MASETMSANLPAPKTFAPSREDVLSTLGFFFGDPAVPEKLKDYSEHHAMTYRTHHTITTTTTTPYSPGRTPVSIPTLILTCFCTQL